MSKKTQNNSLKTKKTAPDLDDLDKGQGKTQSFSNDNDATPSKNEKILNVLKGQEKRPQDRSVQQDEKQEEEKAKKFLKAGVFSKLPAWLRAALVKFWFSAAVFFFIGFGTVEVDRNYYFLIAAIGLVIGLFTDFIATPFLNMCDGVKADAYKYNLFDLKLKKFRVLNTIFNLLYAVAVCFAIFYIYAGINMLINNAKGHDDGTVMFLAEPFLFGLFYILIDFLVIFSRNFVIFVIGKIKDNLEAEEFEESRD